MCNICITKKLLYTLSHCATPVFRLHTFAGHWCWGWWATILTVLTNSNILRCVFFARALCVHHITVYENEEPFTHVCNTYVTKQSGVAKAVTFIYARSGNVQLIRNLCYNISPIVHDVENCSSNAWSWQCLQKCSIQSTKPCMQSTNRTPAFIAAS